MERYDPSIVPDREEWLALDESERIEMVGEHHRDHPEEGFEGSETLHASIHVIVENQIALEVEPVPETMARLLRQGLDRHDALHAIGAIVAEDVYHLMNKDVDAWNPAKYRSRIRKLTAKRWKKGKW